MFSKCGSSFLRIAEFDSLFERCIRKKVEQKHESVVAVLSAAKEGCELQKQPLNISYLENHMCFVFRCLRSQQFNLLVKKRCTDLLEIMAHLTNVENWPPDPLKPKTRFNQISFLRFLRKFYSLNTDTVFLAKTRSPNSYSPHTCHELVVSCSISVIIVMSQFRVAICRDTMT